MIIRYQSSVTRPSDTNVYASGDLVANSTTAGSVTPLSYDVTDFSEQKSFFVRRVKMHKDGTSVTNSSFRVHLFSASPTVANGDNGAFSCNKAANYIGAFDVTIDCAFTDGAAGIGLPVTGNEAAVVGRDNTIYALIEARAAYTPASGEIFTVTLEIYN